MRPQKRKQHSYVNMVESRTGYGVLNFARRFLIATRSLFQTEDFFRARLTNL